MTGPESKDFGSASTYIKGENLVGNCLMDARDQKQNILVNLDPFHRPQYMQLHKGEAGHWPSCKNL